MLFFFQWNLVCDQQGVGELSQLVVMAGQIVGGTVFTSLSDRYGRKSVYVPAYMLFFILSLALAFVPLFAMFVVLRFILGALLQVGL